MNDAALLLCEGYDDRAFLAQWLEVLGWQPGLRCKYDAWGEVPAGVFTFAKGSWELRLVECKGKARQVVVARTYLAKPAVSVGKLIFARDADDPTTTDFDAARREHLGGLREPLAGLLRSCTIDVVLWGTLDPPPTLGVPAAQTLERIVASALAEADPPRAESVARWLGDEPRFEGPEHKAVALSHMAKWHADEDRDRFYRSVWMRHRSLLEARLRSTGMWDVIAAIA